VGKVDIRFSQVALNRSELEKVFEGVNLSSTPFHQFALIDPIRASGHHVSSHTRTRAQ